jgi:PhnB protein
MEMAPYLSFKGECEAAFTFYEKCFGGRRGEMFRYAGSPIADQVPANWADKIMHGSVTVGDKLLMGADVASERYEEPKGFSLALHLKSTAETERIFHELARNGKVVMPLEKTFWAERFGMLIDRFGIPWAINCEG